MPQSMHEKKLPGGGVGNLDNFELYSRLGNFVVLFSLNILVTQTRLETSILSSIGGCVIEETPCGCNCPHSPSRDLITFQYKLRNLKPGLQRITEGTGIRRCYRMVRKSTESSYYILHCESSYSSWPILHKLRGEAEDKIFNSRETSRPDLSRILLLTLGFHCSPNSSTPKALREGSQKKMVILWSFDHTPLTPPPEAHLWSPCCEFF